MAFVLFPLEVWEMILGKVDESSDVANVLRAYPELREQQVGLKEQKIFVLFEEIFPHVFPWLPEEELLKCRQVCPRWTGTVDNHLVNHQDNRAFEQVNCQSWIPPAHPSHYNLDWYFPGIREFSSLEVCEKFLRDMGQHPPGRNPFLGRSVYISQEGLGSLPVDTFWKDGLLEVLRKFGEHVWFLRLRLRLARADCSAELFLKCLSCCNNLKSMEIITSRSGEDIERFLHSSSENNSLPVFPQLEALELCYAKLNKTMVNLLLMGYSTQLRRLSIHTRFWKEEYSQLFPNLRELSLCEAIWGDSLRNLLGVINTPELRSLEIQFSAGFHLDDPDYIYYVNEIFPILTRFPKITSAVFTSSSTLRLGRGMSSDIHSISIPSLKSLVIWSDHGHYHEMDHLALETLKCFPSLEYLKVAGKVRVDRLWGMLPRLKKVTVGGYYGKCSTHQRDSGAAIVTAQRG